MVPRPRRRSSRPCADELLDGPPHRRPREAQPVGHGDLVLEGVARLELPARDRRTQLLGQLVVERDRRLAVDADVNGVGHGRTLASARERAQMCSCQHTFVSSPRALDDEHRHVDVEEDVLRHAAEERLADGGATAGADDEEVGCDLRDLAEDGGRDVAHPRFARDEVQVPRDLLERVVIGERLLDGVGDAGPVGLGDVLVQGVDDVDDVQAGPRGRRPRGRPPTAPARRTPTPDVRQRRS